MPIQPWLFPVPITEAAFECPSARWRPFNIRTDPGAAGPWSFGIAKVSPVAFWEGQTAADGNSRGRLGGGRAVTYRGYHVKGVGRTPAAANWNDPADHYHGNGQMSPSSAIREQLISRVLERAGLGAAIVPCEAVLLAPIATRDRAAHRVTLDARARQGKRDSAASAAMIALSLKRANFARFSNFAFALDRFEREAAWTGRLMIEFERFLSPPGARDPQGTPESIAEAVEAAFERAFRNMLAFASKGLCWIHLLNNHTLDGRWVDIETPHFTGHPFVGKLLVGGPRGEPQIAGFECYEIIRSQRWMARWLDFKLGFLSEPGLIDHPAATAFIAAVRAAVRARLRKSMLFDEAAARDRAERFLAAELGLDGAADRRSLRRLSRYCYLTSVRGVNEPPPELEWRPLAQPPAAPSPGGVVTLAAPFAPTDLAPAARRFAADLAAAEAITTPAEMFEWLAHRGR